MRAPWDFSEPATDPENAVPNLPSAEGRALGRELARLCDIEETRLRGLFPRLQLRCGDCAFRAGTRPNGSVETLMDAVKCVAESTPFYCHHGMPDGVPSDRLCAGYAMVAGYADDVGELANGRIPA